MRSIARLLILAGAGAVATSAFLPWVTVEGVPLNLDLLNTRIAAAGQTVSGTETPAWPFVVGVGGLVAALALFNLARKLVVVLGLLTTVAGAGLVYYVLNVVDIETSGDAIQSTVASALVQSTAESGPFLLLAGGLAILVGSVLRS